MATKPDILLTYHEMLLPTMLLHPLVTLSYEIVLQTKTTISPLSQNLWAQILAGW